MEEPVWIREDVVILLNGRDLEASAEETYLTFLRLAEGRFSEQELASWIRDHLTASSHA